MARTLVIFAFCLCVAVAFAADLRRLSVPKTAGVVAGTPEAAKTVSDAKDGDQQTASSFYGYPGYGFGGPWGYGGGWGGGYGGFYGGGWGYPGYGYGYGYPGGYYGGFW